MNSGATAERVYDAVKRRILTGTVRPGERIEVAALAEDLSSSNTPIRDALHLLVGERLIETRAGDGFHLPHLDAADLTDLYQWNAQLLLQALRLSARRDAEWIPSDEIAIDDPADATGAVFASIARHAGNAEYDREIRSINDRLHAVRIAEATVLTDWRAEIASLTAASEQDSLPALRRMIATYHRRRERVATESLRGLHQLGS